MPRTTLDPSAYIDARWERRRKKRNSVTINAETAENAALEEFYSEFVRYIYLHWLETGASRKLSIAAFRQAIRQGEILANNHEAQEFVRQQSLVSTRPRTLLSAPSEGS